MYKVGDILLYRNKSFNKGDKYYVISISINIYDKEIIHISNGSDSNFHFTEKYINDIFITLSEHRNKIIENLI